MKSTTVIIPVHNRRETTLACLRRLTADAVPAWACIVVVDDGSTDGTGEAVRREFPDVQIERGNGQLWWTGAICAGMRRALADGAEFVVWLNDDTFPAPDALRSLVELARDRHAIVGGAVYVDATDSRPAYGGFRRGWHGLRDLAWPQSGVVSCAALNGNFVCLPASVIGRIGLPDAVHLPHGLADTDYTLRASAAGIPVLLATSCRATAQPNLGLNYRSWLLSDVPIRELWRHLRHPGSFYHQPAHFIFHWRHWGLAGAAYSAWLVLKLALISVVRLIVPQAWLRRLRGSRSAAWQHEVKHS